jgi:hypothetical protein
MEIENVKKAFLKLEKIISEMPIDSVRIQGWQTQKYAKLSRKRDFYAKERMKLMALLYEERIEYINGQFEKF